MIMSDKVLTPAEVARIRTVMESPSTSISKKFLYHSAELLCDSHEVQRATIARLRGLIEGMGHEVGCAANKCKVCDEVAYEYELPHGACPRYESYQCNCVKLKVNL